MYTLEARGKPSTWLPREGLVEHIDFLNKLFLNQHKTAAPTAMTTATVATTRTLHVPLSMLIPM